MDRKKVAALLESGVLQAYAEGKTIQKFYSHEQWWRDLDSPTFGGEPASYRVKPEPLHDWVVESNDYKGNWFILRNMSASEFKKAYGERHYRQLVDVTDEGECNGN